MMQKLRAAKKEAVQQKKKTTLGSLYRVKVKDEPPLDVKIESLVKLLIEKYLNVPGNEKQIQRSKLFHYF